MSAGFIICYQPNDWFEAKTLFPVSHMSGEYMEYISDAILVSVNRPHGMQFLHYFEYVVQCGSGALAE